MNENVEERSRVKSENSSTATCCPNRTCCKTQFQSKRINVLSGIHVNKFEHIITYLSINSILDKQRNNPKKFAMIYRAHNLNTSSKTLATKVRF